MCAPEGRCRRHAPTPVAAEQMTSAGTIWLATFDDDRCGEGRHAAARTLPKLLQGDLGDRDLGDLDPGDSIAKGNSPPGHI